MNLGAPEIILVMIVLFFFFGASKIPEIMKGLGSGLRVFRKAARDIQDDIEKDVKNIEPKENHDETHKESKGSPLPPVNNGRHVE